ncbi:MAG: hydroxymethylglutaryl-CoA lyase [Bacteroidetes bacterium]|nr:hydroxymethylglutaryl-CoA lyase [Bacteroidota bacterium]
MQGIETFIPTATKVRYINQLLKVGFDTIDFGSFVSPKAIPQMKDTKEVLAQLDLSSSTTKLLAIVANVRGAEEASRHQEINYLGFPFSISETFQQRNTNKSISEAMYNLKEIQNLSLRSNKVLVTYISMGFGNPYGDPYNETVVQEFIGSLNEIGVTIISLADTIGVSNVDNIKRLFSNAIASFPHIEFGAHLHSNPNSAYEKIGAAIQAGCTRFDGALKGFGGCPMAKDDLVGNIATETIIKCLSDFNFSTTINQGQFDKAYGMTSQVMG